MVMCTYLLKYTSYKISIGCLGNILNFDVALIQLKFHASVFTYCLVQKKQQLPCTNRNDNIVL